MGHWVGPGSARADIERAAAAFEGEFAFLARRLDTGEELGYRAEALMPPASVIKLAAMATAYRLAEDGELDLGAPVTVGPADAARGSGVLRYLQDGATLTFRDLIRLMVNVSDNVATTAVLRAVGIGRMNRYLASLGFPGTQLIFPPRDEDGPRGYGTSTARELCGLLELIAHGELASEDASREMRAHLATQQHGDQVARYLPHNLYAADLGQTPRVRVLNKTGFTFGVRADAAIVEVDGSGFVIATLNEGSPDRGFSPDHAGNILNGSIARIVFDHWYPGLAEEVGQP